MRRRETIPVLADSRVTDSRKMFDKRAQRCTLAMCLLPLAANYVSAQDGMNADMMHEVRDVLADLMMTSLLYSSWLHASVLDCSCEMRFHDKFPPTSACLRQ